MKTNNLKKFFTAFMVFCIIDVVVVVVSLTGRFVMATGLPGVLLIVGVLAFIVWRKRRRGISASVDADNSDDDDNN